MKNSQRFIAFTILIGALILSGFLLFNKADHELSFGFPTSPKYSETVIIETIDDSTKKVAEKIAESIFQENPSGPAKTDGKLGIALKDPEEIVAEILSESTAGVEERILSPELFFDDLEIINNASKEDIAFYFQSRGDIIVSANKEVVQKGADLSKPSVETFSILLAATSKSLSELYNLPVPKEALFIHKEQIRLLAIQENIFENLVNYERDPIVASISVPLLFSVNEELVALSNTIAEFIETNNIDI